MWVSLSVYRSICAKPSDDWKAKSKPYRQLPPDLPGQQIDARHCYEPPIEVPNRGTATRHRVGRIQPPAPRRIGRKV
jgi:hypothetical protein